jgi:hypothetical protein
MNTASFHWMKEALLHAFPMLKGKRSIMQIRRELRIPGSRNSEARHCRAPLEARGFSPGRTELYVFHAFNPKTITTPWEMAGWYSWGNKLLAAMDHRG